MNEMSVAEKGALSVTYEVMGNKVDLDLDFVKKYLVRGRAELVSNQEVLFFMNLCKMQKLNPLTGSEVYLIKYSKDDPAQMVVGKGAYMRRAFEHPDYIGKEDGITVQRGNDIIQKEGCCLYPGEKLIGGWCRVHYMRGGKERTCFKEVELAEYNKGMANWKSKPATMINKVSVSQCVREAFPKDYEGMYSEEEMIASGAVPVYGTEAEVIDVELPKDRTLTQEETQQILGRIKECFPDNESRNSAYVTLLNRAGKNSTKDILISELPDIMQIIDQLIKEYSTAKPEENTEPTEATAE